MTNKISNDEKLELVSFIEKQIKTLRPDLNNHQIRKVFSYGYGIFSERTKNQ